MKAARITMRGTLEREASDMGARMAKWGLGVRHGGILKKEVDGKKKRLGVTWKNLIKDAQEEFDAFVKTGDLKRALEEMEKFDCAVERMTADTAKVVPLSKATYNGFSQMVKLGIETTRNSFNCPENGADKYEGLVENAWTELEELEKDIKKKVGSMGLWGEGGDEGVRKALESWVEKRMEIDKLRSLWRVALVCKQNPLEVTRQAVLKREEGEEVVLVKEKELGEGGVVGMVDWYEKAKVHLKYCVAMGYMELDGI
jgi:hypothetical protein